MLVSGRTGEDRVKRFAEMEVGMRVRMTKRRALEFIVGKVVLLSLELNCGSDASDVVDRSERAS